LAKLARDYGGKGVAFVGINANAQDSVTKIAAYAQQHKIDFPILKDLENKVADQLGAERTPEVFLLDQDRVVRYHGRIDDQFGIGHVKDQPKRQDLAIAIDELLDGKAVSQPVTKAEGCFIGRVPKAKGDNSVTYSKDIAPILQKHCVECHRAGEIAPFALTHYDEIVGWADTIVEVIQEGRMPPWHADPKHGKFANIAGSARRNARPCWPGSTPVAPRGTARSCRLPAISPRAGRSAPRTRCSRSRIP